MSDHERIAGLPVIPPSELIRALSALSELIEFHSIQGE